MSDAPKPITTLARPQGRRRRARAALFGLLALAAGMAAWTVMFFDHGRYRFARTGGPFSGFIAVGHWFAYALPVLSLAGMVLAILQMLDGRGVRHRIVGVLTLIMNAAPLTFWMLVVFRVLKVYCPLRLV